MLDALVAWVEEGTLPTAITAHRYTRDNGPERSFLLCADPQQARLKRRDLDARDATNWTCQTVVDGPEL